MTKMEHFDLESSLRVSETEIFRCEKCNFNTESKRGLKIHRRRKHTNLEELVYPKICDFCDRTEYDSARMKNHLKQHTYKKSVYKCEDCEYFAPDELSLDVHSGKKHGTFECGLCGYVCKDLEDLELHLFTSETFTSTYCN